MIKEIQELVHSDLKFVILTPIHRIDSNRALKLGKEMNCCTTFEFVDREKVCVKTLKMTTASRKNQVKIFNNFENIHFGKTPLKNTIWKNKTKERKPKNTSVKSLVSYQTSPTKMYSSTLLFWKYFFLIISYFINYFFYKTYLKV